MIKYEVIDHKIIATTIRGNIFQFDKEDYEKVKNYNWIVDSDSGVYTIINGKRISFHKILFGTNFSYKHIDGNIFNYCKNNIEQVKRSGKVVNCNGYNILYIPEHHRASKNGMVYEHILKAEELLGRELYDEEIVHHIDGNKNNNSLDNLMVFKTKIDHTAFHNGMKAIEENGVWYCPEAYTNLCDNIKIEQTKNNIFKYTKICPSCGKEILKNSQYCKECSPKFIKRQNKHKVEWPTKEELGKLIFVKPFTQIGKMFGVTDNAVRKWCKYYGLPFKSKDIKLQMA